MTVNAGDELECCNRALNLIGQGAITSIEAPTNDIEGTCARLFPFVRDLIFSRHAWNCSDLDRQLAVDADAPPVSGYAYAYRLPSNLTAGPFAVYRDGDLKNPFHDYRIAGPYIHADYERVDIKYRGIPPIANWPPYIFNLIVVALASVLAKPVSDDATRGAELKEEAYGTPQENGQGGLFAVCKGIESKSKPIQSILKNGDPLSATRF